MDGLGATMYFTFPSILNICMLFSSVSTLSGQFSFASFSWPKAMNVPFIDVVLLRAV